MLFIIQFEDIYAEQRERLGEREALMDAHLAFLATLGSKLIASGALREAQGGLPQGGLWLVNAASKAAAEALYLGDPFWQAGLRKSVRVSTWGKAVWSPTFTECIAALDAE